MKKFFKDFKAFIGKGNIIDLAVAVVIGGAFGKIVTSMVNDVIMPLISLLIGGASVADWKWVIQEAIYENGILVTAEAALRYGMFIQAIIDFLIIALFIFIAIRLVMKAQGGLSKLSVNETSLSKEELKALRAEGKTKTQIEEISKAKIAEVAAKAAEVAANLPPVETTETILKEIRDLLKKSN